MDKEWPYVGFELHSWLSYTLVSGIVNGLAFSGCNNTIEAEQRHDRVIRKDNMAMLT